MRMNRKSFIITMAALALTVFVFTVPAKIIKADNGSKLLYTFDKGTTMGWSILNSVDKGGAFDTAATAPIEYSEDLKQDGNKGALKINANYTGKDWDDASIMCDLSDGKDFSAYDTIDYDLVLPADFSGQLKLGTAAQTKTWTWIDDIFTDDYSGLELAKGEKVTINSKEYIKFHITRSKTKVLDNQKDKTFVRLIIKVAATATKYTGPIYIDNIAVSKGGYVYNPVASGSAAGKDDIKIEAEKGKLKGLKKVKDSKASGGVYVDGFDKTSDSLKVTANIKVSGTYAIVIRYKTIGGTKMNPFYLNGEYVTNYTFKDTADFKDTILGEYDLEAGKNTFQLEVSWGWIAVDYIRFVGGTGQQVSKVTLLKDTDKSLAYDVPVTLSALADDAAQYRFMARKAGGDWKDISTYSNSYSCIWVPGEAGDYEIKVYARGFQTTVDKQAEATIQYTAVEAYADKPLVSQMFGDGMVLQRNETNAIYGWDKPNSTVHVTVGKEKYSASADFSGEWRVEIGKHKAGGPYTITVKGSSQKVKFTDVLFGDVWLCSGQSNMAFTLSGATNSYSEIKKSNYPNIRYIKIPQKTSAVPVKTLDNTAVWNKCSPDTSSQLSAVAYFFARKLNKDLKVPIGIVFSAVGGTKAESWTSYDSLQTLPDYKDSAYAIQTGAKDIEIEKSPVALYNGMIAPVTPYQLKGVLWYQGESNWGETSYKVLLPALIADWRMHFNDPDLPFIIVQIPAYGAVQSDSSPVQTIAGLPEVREAQLFTMLNDKNVGMVTTIDLGEPENIHPANKQDVGARTAICAEGKFYGKDIVYSGPIYDSMFISGDKITISFTSTGSGLMAGKKTGLKPVKEVKNGKLTGFAIAGEDGVFYNADAVISGDKVVVSSSKVKNPVSVRFGWYDSPVINLYNKEGLIASPFRTDVK